MTFTKHEHGAWCHPSADGCPSDMPAPHLSIAERVTVQRFTAAVPALESHVPISLWPVYGYEIEDFGDPYGGTSRR